MVVTAMVHYIVEGCFSYLLDFNKNYFNYCLSCNNSLKTEKMINVALYPHYEVNFVV